MFELLNYLNNYFVRTVETASITFDSTLKTITGYKETYLPGQYILVENSILNDGVYLISTVNAGTITVAETLADETSDCYMWGLAIPKDLVALNAEIDTYTQNTSDGLASESQGSRSVSYKDGSSWMQVFKPRLIPYKRIYSDKYRLTNYNWQER